MGFHSEMIIAFSELMACIHLRLMHQNACIIRANMMQCGTKMVPLCLRPEKRDADPFFVTCRSCRLPSMKHRKKICNAVAQTAPCSRRQASRTERRLNRTCDFLQYADFGALSQQPLCYRYREECHRQSVLWQVVYQYSDRIRSLRIRSPVNINGRSGCWRS